MSLNNNNLRSINLRQLDAQLARFERVRGQTVPKGGWMKAIRRAIGMTSAQLARRLGVSQPTAISLETRESKGSITLDKLARAADALDCELVYALVPRTTLSKRREHQARATADAVLKRVSHSMNLEEQGVDATKTKRLRDEIADDLLRSWASMIWDRPEPRA